MSQSTFQRAVGAAAPGIVFSNDRRPIPPPAGHTTVQFHLSPREGGVRLSITLGDEPPLLLDLASEEQAATAVGRLFALAAEIEDEDVT
ncbi:hypothetical protein [Aeromicrobium sp. CF3.5]|uniref:hypothetical protein n=1 Tax=Aeromicrobium sp. CF3.5 TaxID=3373078 RepID=UPI003EE5629A